MKLLLHVCCGPCATFPVEVLRNEDIRFEGYFYNPNIHPLEEFNRRKENAQKCANHLGFNLHINEDFREETWKSFSGSATERCTMCYRLRLQETARFAKENGFDAYSTTLLVSPYQNHELIKELGVMYAREFGINFNATDFRPGFRKGQNTAREMGLYRQKYCGCIHSIP